MRSHGVVRGGIIFPVIIRLLVVIPPVIRRGLLVVIPPPPVIRRVAFVAGSFTEHGRERRGAGLPEERGARGEPLGHGRRLRSAQSLRRVHTKASGGLAFRARHQGGLWLRPDGPTPERDRRPTARTCRRRCGWRSGGGRGGASPEGVPRPASRSSRHSSWTGSPHPRVRSINYDDTQIDTYSLSLSPLQVLNLAPDTVLD